MKMIHEIGRAVFLTTEYRTAKAAFLTSTLEEQERRFFYALMLRSRGRKSLDLDYCIDIPEQPFRVNLDPDAYMRILNNLIQNVIAHSHADKIEISLSKQNGDIKILVSDNGVGIGKEDLKHIFERLYKCDKGRSEKGSGLGLAIAHQLVEKMNGTITAESVQGKGTAFTLIFPLAD